MNKQETKPILEFTVSQMIPQIGLNSREKFVCLRVFNATERHTIAEWEQLLKQKGIR